MKKENDRSGSNGPGDTRYVPDDWSGSKYSNCPNCLIGATYQSNSRGPSDSNDSGSHIFEGATVDLKLLWNQSSHCGIPSSAFLSFTQLTSAQFLLHGSFLVVPFDRGKMYFLFLMKPFSFLTEARHFLS